LLKQQEACEGSLEQTQEKPTFILKTEFQVWKKLMPKEKKKVWTWKISGAPAGSLGWEHRQYLKARDI